jgi:hypothetical protein
MEYLDWLSDYKHLKDCIPQILFEFKLQLIVSYIRETSILFSALSFGDNIVLP